MVDTRACVRLEPRRNAAVWAMDAWEAMANAMLLVRRVVVRIGVWRRLVQKAKNRQLRLSPEGGRRVPRATRGERLGASGSPISSMDT